MIVRLCENVLDNTKVQIRSDDKRFTEAFGNGPRVITLKKLMPELTQMATWCNNELQEEFLIEID